MDSTRLISEYIRDINALLPIHGDSEKRFVSDIENSARAFVEDNPACNKADLHEELGTPSEIVSSYFESIDTDELIKRIKSSKQLKTLLSIIIAILFFIGGIVAYTCYSNYIEGQQQYIDREITEVNEVTVDNN